MDWLELEQKGIIVAKALTMGVLPRGAQENTKR
jgi:hypothetical protein